MKIFVSKKLNGGGNEFIKDFKSIIQRKTGKVGTIFEFCSGYGQIGFSLLDAGLCDNLILSDINPKAIELAQKTIDKNKLNARAYVSDGLSGIPDFEQFDIVVANMPHFKNKFGKGKLSDDIDFKLHEEFYNNIRNFLKKDGLIIVVENRMGSTEKDFMPYLVDNKFYLLEVIEKKPYYFMVVGK